MFIYEVSNPSGGLVYHWRAWRYAASTWRPFIQQVSTWLRDWETTEEELIVFGFSAGYTVCPEFLSRFKKLIVVEPDRWAKWFGQFSHPHASWVHANSILTCEREARQFFSMHPHAAVLFSNVLGQLNLLQPNIVSPSEQGIRSVLKLLEGRNWASYHDVLSSAVPPTRSAGELQAATVETLAHYFWQQGAEVIDHNTLWLSGERASAFRVWQLTPRRHHVIGFVGPSI